MTEIQKKFWESQRAAFACSDKRGLRWHPMMIRLALSLHCKASVGYDYLVESGVLILPSSRRLYDYYSHFIEAKEGCQGEIISGIKRKLDLSGTGEHFSYINVMFDEMHKRSGLVTSKSTGELIGFTNMSEAEKELEMLQKVLEQKTYKPKLAKKVLVYMAQSVSSAAVKDVVAVFSTDDLSAVQLYTRTWDVIYHLEDAGVKVICLICDGAATNRKFIRMHTSLDKHSNEIYCTQNLYSVLERLYDITKGNKFMETKLTKAHVKLTSFSCMTVLLATQVLSASVANSIEANSSHESLEKLDTSELVKLIRLMNSFFDCMNGKEDFQEETAEGNGYELRNPDLAAYKSVDNPRFEFLENFFLNYFEDWKQDV
ncbi:Transposable element P transposase [Frankliniella fusca]|uniref:Transposable element P transposase n=1 Tax=Frankliniella fusca TaxID=407009 RepID=A0AAE1LJ30_9NEOP|nr:Transposable element P transposase [Frankliniella fusca]